MVTAKAWAIGDPCPNGCGDLKPVPLPSDEQRAAAANRDNPEPLPPSVDSADPRQIAELGELHRCGRCGYASRVKADDDGELAAGEVADDDKAPARRRASRPAKA